MEMEVPDGINEVQALQIGLLRRIGWQGRRNDLDGNRVADDLIANRHLWRSFITTGDSAVRLRDIAEHPWAEGCGFWNADTLLVWVEPGMEGQLRALADTWLATSKEWIDQEPGAGAVNYEDGRYYLGLGRDGGKVLKLWWD